MTPHLQHPADSHDLIRVHGARENNLKDISVELPKRRLTVFTGVSGSGKSSLVFATIAAESPQHAQVLEVLRAARRLLHANEVVQAGEDGARVADAILHPPCLTISTGLRCPRQISSSAIWRDRASIISNRCAVVRLRW
jgi:energy-coupling factor transporter ATP-binding protein EcfA2